jgi:hypothetical protein
MLYGLQFFSEFGDNFVDITYYSVIDHFVDPCNYVGVEGGTCYSGKYATSGGQVISGKFYSPADGSNYVTQSAWVGHMAIDVVSRSGWNGSYYGVYASASGTAYLVKDAAWGSWCYTGKPYNGPAYGIVIDHGDGIKTLYWHIQP